MKTREHIQNFDASPGNMTWKGNIGWSVNEYRTFSYKERGNITIIIKITLFYFLFFFWKKIQLKCKKTCAFDRYWHIVFYGFSRTFKIKKVRKIFIFWSSHMTLLLVYKNFPVQILKEGYLHGIIIEFKLYD